MATSAVAISSSTETRSLAQGAMVVLGRFFFALIFLMSGPNHFTKQTIAFSASQGVPLAAIAVPLLICNLGYGDPSRLRPRNPRLNFEEAAVIL
jgi:uncharacterized membrane protein YphA (DoxX/SURF4 family)